MYFSFYSNCIWRIFTELCSLCSSWIFPCQQLPLPKDAECVNIRVSYTKPSVVLKSNSLLVARESVFVAVTEELPARGICTEWPVKMIVCRAWTHSVLTDYLPSQPSGLEYLCVNADVSELILAALREELTECHKNLTFCVLYMPNIRVKNLLWSLSTER